jgi:methyl-accepting chemotaxis protein
LTELKSRNPTMKNLMIKTRLGLLVAAMLGVLVATAVFGVLRYKGANDVIRTLYEDRVVCLKQLKVVSDSYVVAISNAAAKVSDSTLGVAEAVKGIGEARARAAKEWKDYAGTYMDPPEKALFDKASLQLKSADEAVQRLVTLFGGNDWETTRAYVDRDLPRALSPLVETLNQLTQLQLDVSEELYKTSQSEFEAMLLRSIAVTAVTIGMVVWAAWLLTRSITRPLSQAIRVAEAVAAGDLSTRIEADGRDETSQLLAALRRMSEGLTDIVGQVRASSDSIATGSSQIAMGNADLSHRTEAQASNLQQTAASMEELSGTVKQNADAARAASQLAISARDAAREGGAVVDQVVSNMQLISAASARIGDIIGVIDGIAFQTNILALNAAVEAARAGEQGRGFAVVAGEVRALAQRSAQAAREIKGLIGESTQRVEAGSQLVGDAGRTMGEIVTRVQRVSDLIGDIGSAGVEQSRGVEQIGQAVAQLDQVTQQNAALVEQSAAAAESLKLQAEQMTQMVARFRLEGRPGDPGV